MHAMNVSYHQNELIMDFAAFIEIVWQNWCSKSTSSVCIGSDFSFHSTGAIERDLQIPLFANGALDFEYFCDAPNFFNVTRPYKHSVTVWPCNTGCYVQLFCCY